MGYENRDRSCWGCKFFIQQDPAYCNGNCVRNPPTKNDQTIGQAAQAIDPNFAVFANVLEPETGFCGQYVPAVIAPPATVPPQRPGVPA